MIKNSIITKYLIKENIFSFLIVFSFSCLLFISIDLIELIRRSSSKEVDFIILVKMAILVRSAKYQQSPACAIWYVGLSARYKEQQVAKNGGVHSRMGK